MARTSSSSDSDEPQRNRRHHGRQRPEAGAASPHSPNGRYKPRSPDGRTAAARTSRVPPSDRTARMQRDGHSSESGGSESGEGRDKRLISKGDQRVGRRQQQLEDGEIEKESDHYRSNGTDRDDRNDRWEEGEWKKDRRRVDGDADRERRRERVRDDEEGEGKWETSRRESPRDGGNDGSSRERVTEKGRDYRDRDLGNDRRRERLRDEDDAGKRERRIEEKIDSYGDERKRETERERMQVDEDDANRKRDSRQERGRDDRSAKDRKNDSPRHQDGPREERGRDDRRAKDRKNDSPRRQDGPREKRRGVRYESSDEEVSPHRREKNKDRDAWNRRDEKRREGDSRRREEEGAKKVEKQPKPLPAPDPMAKRTGGIYIPPFKLAQMMRDVQDKSSEAYQRLSWDALRKSINGLVNKVNATNIKNIIPELFSENLIRGRGLFCRSCMKSQMASPGFTDVFAALVAVVNTKFPEVGRLLVSRIVLQLKRAYKRNDKPQLLAATKFIAHLVNQLVAHEVIALELLTVLLENPTDDGVEVAVGFVKECGALLQDISPQGLHGIFERFRGILHEGEIDKRVQFLIESLFAIRKAKFQGFPAVRPELDLVEQEDQFTHEISLSEDIDPETHLDIFKPNPNFLEDDKAYEDLKKNILGAESSDEEEGSEAGSDDEDEEESEEEDDEQMQIKDETETNLINLRRTIYLTIMSSLDFEEAGHKLLKIKLEPGQEMELCIMLLECCSQERTYNRYYGLLGQRFCMINKIHQENFEKCFVQQYLMIHRLETNKLRNVAKFFAHLLATKALSWHVLAYIRLTEEDTTSSSRIFIKILFQELSEHLGIRLLNETLNDPTMQESFESIFPKDNPKNTRFSINFFTSIGLGGITESLREYLKNMPRLIMQQQKPIAESEDESGSSSGSGSDSGSDSESKSESSSDESERKKRHAKRNKSESSSDESERKKRHVKRSKRN